MAFLAVDRRSGFNRLQAAVYEGDYNTVLAAFVYTENLLKEMSIVSTLNSATIFPGKTACDILSGLDEKGHADIKKLYKEHAEKFATLSELHKCSDINDSETAIELVLHHGTDVNIPAKGNRTPLFWASLQSSSVFFKTLIDLGADTNSQRDDQSTPLIMASYWNNYMAVRLLTEAGVDAEIKCDTSNTALHLSAINGFSHISKLLMESGFNVNLQNNSGKTPLCLAVQNGYKHLVKVLLENNADVNMCDKHEPNERLFIVRGMNRGRQAWHYVTVEKPLLGLFHKRVNGGVKLDVADFGTVIGSGLGENPPDFKTADILKKASDLQKDVQGKTALHVACGIKDENLEIIELLVKHGADIDIRDGDGFTSLQIAAIFGKMQIVKKLVELKADVNLAAMDGKDAADLAQLNEETEIEQYLKLKRSSLRKLWNALVRRQ
ncbi:Ankyrin repeat, SAM and basic leucine zipper [Desmophyllum pertusum]|uniref:Ankyrin repeat, SAM and basic leucine zipper n=1 Tax=Desmophyllum pertusum TaxID=174260 RepID=A0A9X0D4T1_9CNID|nr:Ankyrin repeat, SAM and basic leucine zipper [Desmophyllum pertusum]